MSYYFVDDNPNFGKPGELAYLVFQDDKRRERGDYDCQDETPMDAVRSIIAIERDYRQYCGIPGDFVVAARSPDESEFPINPDALPGDSDYVDLLKDENGYPVDPSYWMFWTRDV